MRQDRNNFFVAKDIKYTLDDLIKNTIYPCTTTDSSQSFNGLKDIVQTITAPIYAPLIWGALSLAATIALATATVASITLLMIAGGFAMANKPTVAAVICDCAKEDCKLIKTCSEYIATLAIAALFSIPENLFKLIARTVETIKAPAEENPAFMI